EGFGSYEARQIVERYPIGGRITAYYNPRNPLDSFLVRELSFGLYFLILLPMVHVCWVVGIYFGRVLQWPAPIPPIPSVGGWLEVDAVNPLQVRRRAWMLVAMIWYGVGLAALTHYYLNAPGSYPPEAKIGTVGVVVMGFIPLIGFMYF